MRRAWGRAGVSAVILHLAAAATWGAAVEGRVRRVGLFEGASPLFRIGCWSFVEIDLRYRGDHPLDGELRLEQRDRDGDVVASVLPVALVPNAEWRAYEIFFVPGDDASRAAMSVKFYDGAGRLAPMLDDTGQIVGEWLCPTAADLPADDLLVVDLTTPRRLIHASLLATRESPDGAVVNARRIRSLPPTALPSRWQGLEAVDAIVWEDADPSALTQAQIDALLGWVRAGGRLLITAGKNWQALANSPLAAALPATIDRVTQAQDAPGLLALVDNTAFAERLNRAYQQTPFLRCVMTPSAGAAPLPATAPGPPIALRHLLGGGSVTLVGAPLTQLLPPPKGASAADEPPEDEAFRRIACEKVVGRSLLALPQTRLDDRGFLPFEAQDLFGLVRQTIGFASVGTAFLVFAILFAFAYAFTATTGSYWYLKRRAWEHHAWTAFALVGLAGSVIGTGMVWVLRGFTTRLWQTTVVDGWSGANEATARCLFGVKTHNHTRIDLRLPGAGDDAGSRDGGLLHVPPGSSSFGAPSLTFAAAEEYRSQLAGTFLAEVPIRATVKEFDGFWRGALGGSLDARLVTRRTGEPGVPYEFAEGSYVRNNLGVSLRGCYLIETTEETAGEGEFVNCTCFELGDLPESGPDSQLDGDLLNQRLLYVAPAALTDPPKRRDRLPRLSEMLHAWCVNCQLIRLGAVEEDRPALRINADQEYSAILLLSFFDLLRDEPGRRLGFHRGRGRLLSCSHRITRATALLVGWSSEAPPAVLEMNRAALRPDRSSTIYRFAIPVERHEGVAKPP